MVGRGQDIHAKALVESLERDVALDAGGRTPIHAILDAVRDHLGMEIAFASRFVGDTRAFTHISTAIPLPLGEGDAEPIDQTFCHHILEGRLPALILDAADHPLAMTLPITGALPVGAHINVPLRLSDGSVYGTFCCLSRTPDRSLTDRDLNTLRAFADLASGQIQRDHDVLTRREDLIARIRQVLATGQPSIVFQPIYALDTGLSEGAEALSRFADSADRGPDEWFADAFEVGLGVDLEIAAIKQALAARHYVPGDHYLSFNASPETVLSGRLVPILEAAGAQNLLIELTEHVRVDDYPALREALDGLRRFARIAIDDVGAGYASLRHIISLDPDVLKLDMSLTRHIDRDPARRALAGAMVAFAKSLDASIVAEGIETEAESVVLRDIGISHGQGYFFARPMPPVAAQQHLLGCDAAQPRHPPASLPARITRSA